MINWDWLEQVDYDKLEPFVGNSNDIINHRFKCRHCDIPYTFEYLITRNLFDKACFNHMSNYKNGKWQCCNMPGNVLGCKKQCHDIDFHVKLSKVKDGFKHFVEDGTSIIINGKIYNRVIFQIPMIIWLRIMKRCYKSKNQIPTDTLSSSINEIVLLKTKREYELYFKDSLPKSKINFDGNMYTIVKSTEKSDELILYVNPDADDDSIDNDHDMDNEEPVYDEFINYSIIRYNVYENKKNNS